MITTKGTVLMLQNNIFGKRSENDRIHQHLLIIVAKARVKYFGQDHRNREEINGFLLFRTLTGKKKNKKLTFKQIKKFTSFL